MKTRVSLKYFVNDFRYQISAYTDDFHFLDQIYLKSVFSV